MILIQSNTERTLAHHFDASCALYGAIETGETYRLTSFEEIQSGMLNNLLKQHVAVGSTEFMTEVFKQLGIENVRLPRNSNRKCEFITLEEAHARVAAGEKLFIKPVQIKLFSGLVLDGSVYSCLRGLPDDTQIMAYKPFSDQLLSEWRIYVERNQMVDARHYSGKLLLAPDGGYIHEVLNANKKEFPVCYTIDIGILELPNYGNIFLEEQEHLMNENVVVEFNDMWAIGNYGVPNDIYLRLLKQRYFEIIKK